MAGSCRTPSNPHTLTHATHGVMCAHLQSDTTSTGCACTPVCSLFHRNRYLSRRRSSANPTMQTATRQQTAGPQAQQGEQLHRLSHCLAPVLVLGHPTPLTCIDLLVCHEHAGITVQDPPAEVPVTSCFLGGQRFEGLVGSWFVCMWWVG